MSNFNKPHNQNNPNSPFRLLTIEEIYEHFDIDRINMLMEYTDNNIRKYNLDNVHIHTPLSVSVVDAGAPETTLINGNIQDYQAKVANLEVELRRTRLLAEERLRREGWSEKAPYPSTPKQIPPSQDWFSTKDNDDEVVEVSVNLLKQIAEVLKNKNK